MAESLKLIKQQEEEEMATNERFIVPEVGKRYAGIGIDTFWLQDRARFEKMFNRKLDAFSSEETPTEFFTVIEIDWRGYPRDEAFIEHILRGPDGTGKEQYDGEIDVKVQFENGKEEWQLYEYDHQWGFYNRVLCLGTSRPNQVKEEGKENGTKR